MWKIFSSLLLVLVLTSISLAETIQFGFDEVRFTVERPENWDKKEKNNGVQLTSDDKKTSIAISVNEKKNVSIEDIQQVLPSKLGLTEVKKQERKRLIVISGILEGQPIQIQLYNRDDCLLSIVTAGEDKEKIKACIASLRQVSLTPISDSESK
ncbi:MAG: hypothetical protein IJU40_04315 [Desulfovibrionaceae bacterium]|nr:hypothetical protein [Desulfovibrionaceae bacterium]